MSLQLEYSIGSTTRVIGRYWHNDYDTSSDVDARTSISNDFGKILQPLGTYTC